MPGWPSERNCDYHLCLDEFPMLFACMLPLSPHHCKCARCPRWHRGFSLVPFGSITLRSTNQPLLETCKPAIHYESWGRDAPGTSIDAKQWRFRRHNGKQVISVPWLARCASETLSLLRHRPGREHPPNKGSPCHEEHCHLRSLNYIHQWGG